MNYEQNDIEFKEALEDKRHKDIINLLKQLVVAITTDNNHEKIVQMLNENKQVLERFVNAASNLKVDSGITPESISGLSNDIKKLTKTVEELKELQMKNRTVDFKRNSFGIIQSPIIVKIEK